MRQDRVGEGTDRKRDVDVLESGGGRGVFSWPRLRGWQRQAAIATACLAGLAALGGNAVVEAHARAGAADPRSEARSEAPTEAAAHAAPRATTADTIDLSFADRDHGYALVASCTRLGAQACGYVLQVTTDGGRRWRAVPVPLAPVHRSDGYSASLTTLSPNALWLIDRDQRWFSPDRGRSWRKPAATLGIPATALSQGTPWAMRCALDPQRTDYCRDQVVTVDSRTGTLTPLAHQPPLTIADWFLGRPRPRDGSMWVTGGDDHGRPAIAVSRDNGRSWRVSTVGSPRTPPLGTNVVTHDGQTAYAFVRAQGREGTGIKNGLDAIYVTRDGGARWQRVEPRHAGAQPSSMLGAAVLPDGRLILTTEGIDRAVLHSDDGGRTFAPTKEAPPVSGLHESGGRYIAQDGYGGDYTTIDGVRWDQMTPHKA